MLSAVFYILVFIITCFAGLLYCSSNNRSALDVLHSMGQCDLEEESAENIEQKILNSLNKKNFNLLDGTRAEILFPGYQPNSKQLVISLVVGLILGLIIGVLWAKFASQIYVICLISIAVSYLLFKRHHKKNQQELLQEIEYILPMVMERLTMAVQAGYDVIAGINSIIRTEKESTHAKRLDPVSELLALVLGLSEAGLQFSVALKQVAMAVNSIPLRHAFVHLSLAYDEGGELVAPLTELSEAVQLHYQEAVDERIAKLPAKATFPLVVVFAGLIVIFITTPLLQVMNLVTTMTIK